MEKIAVRAAEQAYRQGMGSWRYPLARAQRLNSGALEGDPIAKRYGHWEPICALTRMLDMSPLTCITVAMSGNLSPSKDADIGVQYRRNQHSQPLRCARYTWWI